MKRFGSIVLVGLLASMLGTFNAGAATHTVTMVSAFSPPGFSPATITIAVGDSIVWDNTDTTPHTAQARDDAPAFFDTGQVSGGQKSNAIVFSKAGTYDYFCLNHQTTMFGSVRVNAAPPPPPPPPPPSPASSPKTSPAAKASPSPSPSKSASAPPSPVATTEAPQTATAQAQPSPTAKVASKKQDDGGIPTAVIVAIVAVLIAGAAGGGLWWMRRTSG